MATAASVDPKSCSRFAKLPLASSYAWYIKDLGWGNLRHMGNAAFLVLIAAKDKSGYERDRLVCWAHGQIQYALGDGGEWALKWSWLVLGLGQDGAWGTLNPKP